LDTPIKETLMVLAHQFAALINSYEGLRIFGVCAANNLQAERDNHIAELFWEAGPKKLRLAVSAYFIAQVEAGNLKLDNADFAGQQFLFMLQAEENMRLVIGLELESNAEQQDSYLHSCVELFCRGYGIE
ncbi:MAG: TetR/AcrR family transcriptional regulator C-terminal domain-containing protein, partial [Sinobacterium sp.]|nr:TetR/AcrR family transcriptional regulator C-terminal domain-containing protein [Sinobacterium sp.]